MGEDWGEGDLTCKDIFKFPPHPNLLPEGEGIRGALTLTKLPAFICGFDLLFALVVGRFLSHHHVVHVRFTNARVGDAHELRFGA